MGKVARAPGASTADLTSAPGETPDWMRDYKRVSQPAPDRLDTIREHARLFRDKILESKDLDARLTAVNKEIESIRFTKLPEIFEKAEVEGIDVPASGNTPGYTFKLEDYYYANIAADWPQAQREAGFATVRELGGEHLIKNEIVILVGKGEGNDKLARRIIKGIEKLIADHPGADITLEQPKSSIPWNTLTAWLREKVETQEEPTREQLETINGKISKQVRPKEIKPVTKPPRR